MQKKPNQNKLVAVAWNSDSLCNASLNPNSIQSGRLSHAGQTSSQKEAARLCVVIWHILDLDSLLHCFKQTLLWPFHEMETGTKAVNVTMSWCEMLVERMRMEWRERSSGTTLAVCGKRDSTMKFRCMRDGQEESRANCDWLPAFQDMLMQSHSLGAQRESRRVAIHPPKEFVRDRLFVGYSPYLGHVTHDVYPGVKNLITAGHSYEAQNSIGALITSVHRIHQNIYLCEGAAERHFKPGACCSSLSLSLCLCFSLCMWRRTRHVGSTRFHKNVPCCLNIKRCFMYLDD